MQMPEKPRPLTLEHSAPEGPVQAAPQAMLPLAQVAQA